MKLDSKLNGSEANIQPRWCPCQGGCVNGCTDACMGCKGNCLGVCTGCQFTSSF